MNKKASLNLLEVAIGLVLGAMVLWVLIVIWDDVLSLLPVEEKMHSQTVENFEKLIKDVNYAVKNNKEHSSFYNYFNEDYIIVSNKGEEYRDAISVVKPDCDTKTCLCLCKKECKTGDSYCKVFENIEFDKALIYKGESYGVLLSISLNGNIVVIKEEK